MPAKTGGWLDRVKQVVSEDNSPKPKADVAPPPMPSFAPPSSLGLPPQPATYAPVQTQPDPPDAEAVNKIKEAVYVPNVGGRPSNFILFMRMWETLGRPTDPQVVVNALKVMAPNLTLTDVSLDLQQHQSLLDNTTSGAKQTYDDQARQTLGKNDEEIATLVAADQKADEEIARHQHEKAERKQRLTQLQAERAEQEGKLNRARARVQAADALVRSELVSMQQLLNH